MTTRPRLRLAAVCGALLVGAMLAAAAQAQNYPNRADHHGRAVRAGRADRRAGPRRGGDAAGEDRPEHRGREQDRRLRRDRRGLCGARRRRTATRCSPIRSPTRRTCITCRCPTARWTTSRRSAGSSTGRRWCSSSTPSCRTRRWRSWSPTPRPTRTSSASARPGPASSPGMALAQLNAAAKTRDRRRALSRLGRGGARGRRRRDPGRVHVLLAGQAAGGRRQGACARGREPEAACRPGPTCRRSRAGLQDRPARLRRSRRAGQDAEADHRISQQAAQRGGADRRSSRRAWRRSA